MATLAGLVQRSRWSCRACGLPLPRLLGECPRCQAKSPGRLQEPQLVAGIESPMLTMDSIDVNDAYVQRLVRTLIEGEGESRAQARSHVLELREHAVEELLRAGVASGRADPEAAVDVLRAMGPGIAPFLFAAGDTLERERLLSVGSRSPATLVGRVVQGFDRTALPHMAPLFTSARPEHRKILIDFFLGLADSRAVPDRARTVPADGDPASAQQGGSRGAAAVPAGRSRGTLRRGDAAARVDVLSRRGGVRGDSGRALIPTSCATCCCGAGRRAR
jgi:hypothetical protein